MGEIEVNPDDRSPLERYSVFTAAEKWCIIILVAYATLFSGLSSFIYYPAIQALSQSLHVSIDKVNLTVTSYLAVATIAPTLFGDLADVLGRRPVYLFTLGLYVVSNISIALSKTYSALLGLRVLQALAISATNSIAYGVVADIATPAERGSFVTIISFAVTMAPSFGPILGGTLTYAAGWHWIFWFLCIAASICLLLMIMFLPETCRAIVRNGSIVPPKYLKLPIKTVMCHWERDAIVVRPKSRIPNPLTSLTILLRKDNAVIILAAGLLYLVYGCVCTSLSVIFENVYGLNQWQIGLVYLPFGLGGTISTFFSGRLLDDAYRKARTKEGLSTNKIAGDDLDHFDIEKARLGIIWIPMAITAASLVSYGWVLHLKEHIAIPLFLQFVIGMSLQIDFSIYNTLLVDKNNRTPAAAQASSNIIRCALAAISIAFLQQTLDNLGLGWTFTLLAGLCVLVIILFVVDHQQGKCWRQAKLLPRQ